MEVKLSHQKIMGQYHTHSHRQSVCVKTYIYLSKVQINNITKKVTRLKVSLVMQKCLLQKLHLPVFKNNTFIPSHQNWLKTHLEPKTLKTQKAKKQILLKQMGTMDLNNLLKQHQKHQQKVLKYYLIKLQKKLPNLQLMRNHYLKDLMEKQKMLQHQNYLSLINIIFLKQLQQLVLEKYLDVKLETHQDLRRFKYKHS